MSRVIARYSRPAMSHIWSDGEKLRRWLEVELAALEGWAEVGTVPREEVAAIRGFQLESGDCRMNGGFAFGRRDGQLMPFVSPVSTAFCVQALTMWEEYQGGRLAADWRKII